MKKQVKFPNALRTATLSAGLFLSASAFAQQVVVKGNVVDETGEPVYLHVDSEQDMAKISYLTDRINAGEQVVMKDIYQWCQGHGIKYNSKFVYRKDFPLKANIWNFYSYQKARRQWNR